MKNENGLGPERAKIFSKILNIILPVLKTNQNQNTQSQGIKQWIYFPPSVQWKDFVSAGITKEQFEDFLEYLAWCEDIPDLTGTQSQHFIDQTDVKLDMLVDDPRQIKYHGGYGKKINLSPRKDDLEKLIKLSKKLLLYSNKELFSKDEEGNLLFRGSRISGINKVKGYYIIFDVVLNNYRDYKDGVIPYETIEKLIVDKGLKETSSIKSRNKRINNALRLNYPQGFFRSAKINRKLISGLVSSSLIEFQRGKGVKFNNF